MRVMSDEVDLCRFAPLCHVSDETRNNPTPFTGEQPDDSLLRFIPLRLAFSGLNFHCPCKQVIQTWNFCPCFPSFSLCLRVPIAFVLGLATLIAAIALNYSNIAQTLASDLASSALLSEHGARKHANVRTRSHGRRGLSSHRHSCFRVAAPVPATPIN